MRPVWRWIFTVMFSVIFITSAIAWVLSKLDKSYGMWESPQFTARRISNWLGVSWYDGRCRLMFFRFGRWDGDRWIDLRSRYGSHGIKQFFADDVSMRHWNHEGGFRRVFLGFELASLPGGSMSSGRAGDFTSYRAVGVPLWLPTIISLCFAALGARVIRRDYIARRSPTKCNSCGYDLRAGHEKCPECGAESHVKTNCGAGVADESAG